MVDQVVYAAKRAGATKILKAGGAQAIAGCPARIMAFGFHNTLDSVSENTGGSMDLSTLDKSSLQFDHVHP